MADLCYCFQGGPTPPPGPNSLTMCQQSAHEHDCQAPSKSCRRTNIWICSIFPGLAGWLHGWAGWHCRQPIWSCTGRTYNSKQLRTSTGESQSKQNKTNKQVDTNGLVVTLEWRLISSLRLMHSRKSQIIALESLSWSSSSFLSQIARKIYHTFLYQCP